MLLYLLFNTHSFQNYLVKRVNSYVNETFHTRINIGEVSYDGWTFFSLRNIQFGDQKLDTTFYVGRLQFNLAGLNIDSTHFILNDAVLDEAVCKITTYKDSTYSLDVINLFSDPNDTISDPNAPPFILEFNNLECMDTRFNYFDSTGEFFPIGFDYNRIDIDNINFRCKKLQIINDSLVFDVKNFSCKERSGFEILRMKSNVIICDKTIELKNLDLVTPNSHIKDYLSLNSKSWEEYSDFNNKVVLKINLNQSDVDMKDITYFVPSFDVYHYKAKVSGNGKGPVSNLNLKNLLLRIGSETRFAGNAKFIGLPNIEETFMDIEADYFSTIKPELEKVIAMDLPQELGDLGLLNYRGKFTGFYQDFVAFGSLETAFGSAQTDLNMKVNEETLLSEYSGNIEMDHFQLGDYLKNKDLGEVDFRGHLVGKGFDLNTLDTKLEASISAFGFRGYTYRNIDIAGEIRNKKLTSQFDINDTNLVINSSLMADLSKPYSHLIVDGEAENVNLKPLNLHKSKIALGTKFKADYHFKDLNNHYGEMWVEDFHYEKSGYSYRVNQLKVESENEDEELFLINGDFVHGKIKGQFDFARLYEELKYWTLNLGEAYYKPRKVEKGEQNFEFELTILNTASISPLFFPGINASNIDLEGEVNSLRESYKLAGYIGNFNTDGWHLNQTTFKITEEEKEKGSLLFGFSNFGRLDTLYIGDFALKADAIPNKINLQYQIRDSLSLVQGEFKHAVLFEPNSFWLDFMPSWLQSGVSRWSIAEGKTIELASDEINFENLILSNLNQQILLDGFYDYDGSKKNISAKITDLDLNTINQFVKEIGVDLGGIANGYLVYKNMGSRDVVITNIETKNLTLDKDTLGDYTLAIGYREEEEDLLIDFVSNKGKINQLKGYGIYDIPKKYLDLNVDFKDSKVTAFQAFVKDYVKLYDGKAELNAKLSGPISQLRLDGQLQLSKVELKVDYLQTTYRFDLAKINFNDNLINIVPFDIFDINKQQAKVSGKVTHKGFTNLKYDLHINDFKSFQVLNTVAKDNDLFYGAAYASGKFSMRGSDNNLAMHIDVVSEKGTKVIINPFGASTETGESYIHYVSRDTLQTFTSLGKGPEFGIGVYMKIKANPNAEIQVIFDAKSDDRIKAKGNGQLKMDYLPDGNFLMNGEYVLTEGEYRFSAMNVVAKKFDLKPGSKIEWHGDPLTGRLNIVGKYSLKTTISQIVNMTNAADPNVRVPVECLININGIVEKPEFTFDLSFPDLQNNVTGAAASELNAVVSNFRREPEMMNQQILFLLISGSFVPITNTNTTANSSFGTQTVSDLLSKQAAGLIGKAVPNIDVSVDLLNASDPTKGRTVLLSASKRFLDNRLEVQTSYAIDQTQTNVSATYNLRKNGSTKLRVFNKSGFDAIYNRNVTTSGTGLFFHKEFDTFSELFKKQGTN
ncbi:MAG: translocation/assembly module TamB [Bacteroidia bacterium]|nr:translocation/assembly module TamB [Bacteroidia bacterium]MCF8425571.1 translocation/assembly module TamB [Bacteroidia bacterium]MCF8447146.1 translocation/assembly module TamB [Bacteroidia bacterium]